jgi:hypothetical protein
VAFRGRRRMSRRSCGRWSGGPKRSPDARGEPRMQRGAGPSIAITAAAPHSLTLLLHSHAFASWTELGGLRGRTFTWPPTGIPRYRRASL